MPAASAGTGSVTISDSPGNGLITFSPLTLTTAQLAAVPSADQATYTVDINGVSETESGPLVSYLLSQAGVTYISTCKNDELRYWIQATGATGVTAEVTAGEIDSGFGDNQAILSVSQNGISLSSPYLIVPGNPALAGDGVTTGDIDGARDVPDVTNLTIGRAAPQLAGFNNGASDNTTTCTSTSGNAGLPSVSSVPAGEVLIDGDVAQPMLLNYAQLGALPQVTQNDTYNTTTTKTFVGPTLYSVLALADPGYMSDPSAADDFYIEVTSNEDAYATLVSWSEIAPSANDNQILLALLQGSGANAVTLLPTDEPSPTGTGDTDPRLTAPGDVKGGRYNDGSAVITVFEAPNEGLVPTSNSASASQVLDGTVTGPAGSLSISAANPSVNFGSLSAGSSSSPASIGDIQYSNTLGDGDDWSVSVAVTALANQVFPVDTIPTSDITFTPGTVTDGPNFSTGTVTAGSAAPFSGGNASTFSTPVSLSTAPPTAQGTFTQTGTVQVAVPTGTPAGTYDGTIQYTITG